MLTLFVFFNVNTNIDGQNTEQPSLFSAHKNSNLAIQARAKGILSAILCRVMTLTTTTHCVRNSNGLPSAADQGLSIQPNALNLHPAHKPVHLPLSLTWFLKHTVPSDIIKLISDSHKSY